MMTDRKPHSHSIGRISVLQTNTYLWLPTLFALPLHLTTQHAQHNKRSFLSVTCQALYHTYGEELQESTLLFPSCHAANQFLVHLANHQSQPTWAPKVHTLATFMQSLYPLTVADKLTLLTVRYKVVQKAPITHCSFVSFLRWGAHMLTDFNTMDHHLISPEALFSEPTPSTSEQPPTRQTSQLLAFFSQALNRAPTAAVQQWSELWQQMPLIYHDYQQTLLAKHIGYSGLQRKMLYADLKAHTLPHLGKRLISIGLGQFTPIEEKILTALHKHTPLASYWDSHSSYVNFCFCLSSLHLQDHHAV